ncbi:MAG: HD-GYP domain-containing protein [Pirellulaceae bacterium]
MSEHSKQNRVKAFSTVVIETAKLKAGHTLSEPINDPQGVLLLNAGLVVTDTTIQHLLDRNIDKIVLSQEDASTMFVPVAMPSKVRAGGGKRLPALPRADHRHDAVAMGVRSLVRAAGIPLKNQIVPHGTQPYDRNLAGHLAARFATNANMVELVMRKVVEGAAGDASVLVEVVNGYTSQMEQDLDHVLASSGHLADFQQPVQRSLRMAMLGMGVGIEMGLDAPKVMEIGTCALVHDWGLFCLPERLRSFSEPFSGDDWEMYKRHPTLTLDALERISGLSPAVTHAAGQVHEMCDGSGYPRELRFDRIHLYARILGPVDAFMALNETRRGRPACVPHDAMACLLHQIPMGRFDGKVVKALLGTLSLFPLGSCVRLSDGRDASVIRRSAKDYARPIVQYLRVDGPHALGDADSSQTILDLSESRLEITDALPTPGKMEMRLDRSLMYDVVWDDPGT